MKRFLLVAAIFAASPTLAVAQTRAPSAVTPWTTIARKSPILGESRTIQIVLPADYATSGHRYPVLLLLDADDEPQFRSGTSTVAFLASRGAIPPMIVVGIRNGANRTRDLTPDSLVPAFLGDAGGGGDRFLDYVEKEVLPTVRARYRTAPFTVFAGHSLGGLMAVHVAATRPDLAHGVIAMSPSLWVNKEAATSRFVQRIAARRAPLRLYSTRGRFEPPIDVSTAHFEEQLTTALARQTASTVRFGHARHDVDSHGLTPLTSLIDGLRFVFAEYSRAVSGADSLPDPMAVDSATLLRAIRETDSTHVRARRVFPASMIGGDTAAVGAPSVSEMLNVAPYFLLLNQNGAGLEYYGAARQIYPRDPQIAKVIGDLHLARRDTAQAVRAYTEAFALANGAAYAETRRSIVDALKPLGVAPGARTAGPRVSPRAPLKRERP